MKTFQITWDSKSDNIDNNELRIEIVINILNDSPEKSLYQPTKSTIVFKSEIEFKTWKERFSMMKDRMYYSICQIDPDLYDDERCEVDLSDTIDTAKSRMNKGKEKMKQIVNETLKEIFIDQNPTNES